ncbi:1-acyl-sn-glycerol-3-phosphate acyltransferase, partial [Streptomyces sp. NPDC059627]
YAGAITRRLRERVQELLDAAQRAYPARPKDATDTWWLPAHLGGTAPTLDQLKAAEAI